jgi:hypothetical protein
MRTTKTTSMAKVRSAAVRCARSRDRRNATLKAAAAALTELEVAIDSDSATELEVEAAENEYEEKVDLLVTEDTALTSDFEAMLATIRSALSGAKPEDVSKA